MAYGLRNPFGAVEAVPETSAYVTRIMALLGGAGALAGRREMPSSWPAIGAHRG
jgi:hypothetical protein